MIHIVVINTCLLSVTVQRLGLVYQVSNITDISLL